MSDDMIIKPGDRRNSGFCLRCGALLMVTPWNDYQCCPDCTKIIEDIQRRVTNAKPGTVKAVNKKMILRPTVRRQIAPLKRSWEEMD